MYIFQIHITYYTAYYAVFFYRMCMYIFEYFLAHEFPSLDYNIQMNYNYQFPRRSLALLLIGTFPDIPDNDTNITFYGL